MDWWYVRAYPGHPDLMDQATRVLIPWLRDQAIREDGPKWFFARYWDMAGHHLRLRVQCPDDGADRIHGRVSEVVDLLRSLESVPAADRLVPDSVPRGLPGAKRARVCLYSPELAKYGGRNGVLLAEELFTASCSWYVENDLAGLDLLFDRSALAVDYMSSLVHAAMPGEEKTFWAAHRRQWSWQLRMAVPGQADLRSLLSRTATGVSAVTDPRDRLQYGLDEHVKAVVEALNRAEAEGNPVERPWLLLHYLHMDLNRWGFVPAEECLLGILAATT